jgi:hypothetical protein
MAQCEATTVFIFLPVDTSPVRAAMSKGIGHPMKL